MDALEQKIIYNKAPKGGFEVAKKFNKGRQQKRNIDRQKLDRYREEIARELGVDMPEKNKNPEPGVPRNSKPAFRFEDDKPLF